MYGEPPQNTRYNEKIALRVLKRPVAFLSHSKGRFGQDLGLILSSALLVT